MTVLLAGGGLLSVNFGLAIWILITFLIFLGILWKFAWGPITRALEKREQNIKESLEAAEKAMKRAEKISQENEEALREAEQKAQQIRKEALEEAEMLRNERIENAKEEANKMIEQARETIEQEKQQALDELRDEVVNLAIQSASRILDEELDEEKNARLVDDYLQNLSNN